MDDPAVSLRFTDAGGLAAFGLPGRGSLLAATDDPPALLIHLLEGAGTPEARLRPVTSQQAAAVGSSVVNDGDGRTHRFTFTDLDGTGLDAVLSVRVPAGSRLTHWTIEVTQPVGLRVADVQFPWVVVPYATDAHPTRTLYPYRDGFLYPSLTPLELEADHASVWSWENDTDVWHHHPGSTIAPFVAHLTDEGGVYLGCHDTTGQVKHVKAVHHRLGDSGAMRLAASHVVGRTEPGTWTLPYDVVLAAVDGDWHDAADLYRDFYDREVAAPRLHERDDVPDWLLDSPIHVVLRACGTDDAAPTDPNAEVVPYENALPALDAIAEATGSPVLPILMSWEGPGPWVYPESFPPVAGEASLRAFADQVRARGWHLGTYANGTQWVTEHKWSGYDGRDHFRQAGGAETVCRRPDGSPWRNAWDLKWRQSYTECLGSPITHRQAIGFVQSVVDLGFDWVQFLDQNCGVATFPCYADDHDHPPLPGEWMTHRMDALLDAFDEVAAGAGRPVVFSVERPPNDHHQPRLHSGDSRPNLKPGSHRWPLHKYLFGDRVLTHSCFGLGPTTHWMAIKTAMACVLGDMPGAILSRDGRLQAYGGAMWPRWDEPPADQEAMLTLLGAVARLRRGAGRDFLVFGRMLADELIGDVDQVSWTDDRGPWTYPAVMQGAWVTPAGTRGVALCNWTREPRTVSVAERWLDGGVVILVGADGAPSGGPVGRTIEIAPLTALMLVEPEARRETEDE
ncbi:DUF6259 domain-containing protein [Aestuariimicrobium soli]|uniref:DUF6259 domain-containing protein n=1 Tax=Aestuariimicrobium soli TaxID=2035834 RepID=UPI003EB7669B